MRERARVAAGVACLAAVLGLGGCVQTSFVPTGGAMAPKARTCEIQVFSASKPDRPFVEVGIVEGEGDWWKADLQDILPKLKEEACLAGGDAIILGANNSFSEGDDGIRVQYVAATVIRWRSH